MGGIIFNLIMSVLGRFFADRLAAHLENYHQEKKAHDIADAPQTKREEVASFGKW